MEMNKPVVKLINISCNTPELFSKIWIVAKDDTPFDEIKPLAPEKLDAFMSTDIPTQEFIDTVWFVGGMPRAFWDQLDRCRLASFWEQSGRVLDYSNFSDVRRYWTSERIAADPKALCIYEDSMAIIQEAYAELLRLGIPAEEARGIIPLHILTRGTFAINLRALKGLIRNRVCFVCQGSYWLPVIEGMLAELKPLLPPKTLKSLVALPCAGGGSCPIEGSVLQRISGEDPNPVCPVYLESFTKNKKEVEARELKRIPKFAELKERYMNLVKSFGLLKGGEKSGDSQKSC
jgi:hypothetical protein